MEVNTITATELRAVEMLASYQVSERDIDAIEVYFFEKGVLKNSAPEWQNQKPFEGNGIISVADSSVLGLFNGDLASYQIKINLAQSSDAFNGLTVSYRVSGWKNIRYVAVGHSAEDGFRHVKIKNIKQDAIVTTNFGYADIAYGLQNKWSKPAAADLNDVRVYISGEPGPDAQIEVYWASRWRENSTSISEKLVSQPIANNPDLFNALKEYFTRCNVYLEEHAKRYLTTGDVPISGEVYLSWAYSEKKPKNLSDTGTYSYTWHAMHPAISLMVYGDENKNIASISAAREIITCWLNDSFYNADADTKYTWYDHGTAERLIAFLFMHHIGVEYHFDHRFMTRLRYAIIKHTQLLESEVFYSFHQRTRYHNHAWFQDMALIAAAVAFKAWPAAERWLNTGINRLEDQLDKLIVRDSGYAIFIENSIGYHLGVQRLTDFAGVLVQLSGHNSVIPAISVELDKWSNFFRYPDYKLPANGDTFKKPLAEKFYRGKPYQQQGLTVLPKAGYAVLKQNVNGQPFMLTMLGSSLCKTHKHEDNLAITLFYDGVEWLTDPSFHSHNYTDEIPSYLRSAEAHNGVHLPGLHYSLEPDNCSLQHDEKPNAWILNGTHNSYKSCTIKRVLELKKNELHLSGTEIVKAKNVVNPFLVFHLGESVTASIEKGDVILKSEYSDIVLVLMVEGPEPIIINGTEDENVRSCIGQGFESYVDSNTVKYRFSNELKWTLKVLN